MRKLTLLLTIMTAIPYQLFCQSISGRNALSLAAGPSIPLGNYSKTDPENVLSGYSKTGETLKIAFSYKLTESLGLEAMVYGQRNRLNTEAFEKLLSNAYFFHDSRSYSNWEVRQKSWLTGSVLAGFTGEFPVNTPNNLSFVAKALGGLALVKSPDLNANSKSDTSYATFNGKYGSGTGPSFLLSTALKHKLSDRVKIFINIEYFETGKISFKEATEIIIATNGGLIIPGIHDFQNSNHPPSSYGQEETGKQTIGSINLNMGISFIL